ncbi:MAG: DUF302 domain-containing protein [Thiobacillaceae bacterium]|jgi:uncharacterized protein (DUF302 family)|nr:DUF302 domain-containing protein [Thiobacillaceae bacterium]
MKPRWLALIAVLALTSPVLAQVPAQSASPEQVQQAMLRQMQIMAAMFDLRTSKLGFEETVSAIKAAAEKRGWKVERLHDVQASMRAGGAKDALPMKVISTCPPGANEKLAKASQGKAPPLPCRVTVFQDKEGKVQVVRLNTSLFAKAMQGEPARVMAEVAAEEDAMLKGIVD